MGKKSQEMFFEIKGDYVMIRVGDIIPDIKTMHTKIVQPQTGILHTNYLKIKRYY